MNFSRWLSLDHSSSGDGSEPSATFAPLSRPLVFSRLLVMVPPSFRALSRGPGAGTWLGPTRSLTRAATSPVAGARPGTLDGETPTVDRAGLVARDRHDRHLRDLSAAHRQRQARGRHRLGRGVHQDGALLSPRARVVAYRLGRGGRGGGVEGDLAGPGRRPGGDRPPP